MIAIVHSIYSQSVHALALNAGSIDYDDGRYCSYMTQDTICKAVECRTIKNIL